MPFKKPNLKAIFLSRPQRFLVEMLLADGLIILAYCPNPGAMKGCLIPGSPALLCDSENTKRKRQYTLKAIEINGVWIGTDTHLANHLVGEALLQGLVPGLDGYEKIERERLVGVGHRVDFLLSGTEGFCYVEIKSATVVEKGVARFPDSITPRSLKHLEGLTIKALEGHRVIFIYFIQRSDAESFSVNETHYPAYFIAYKKAKDAGVETLALSVAVSPKGFGRPTLVRQLKTDY